ncbi:pyridoxal phosphate-dependent aminotransferase [Aurantiacibacter gangjinensis]|uniref:Histidinol-phosphate aminotransferase n=1 Tax=Aurantiacibacter gangjinensis TaxID=502682 RepID=A0A0G9MM60_9SPHN|nr:histidinol-phosphate transaminase [Aurantiacibacter gangjinensis]KLE31775.1 histidinol-phosphate aminotransferase [Aurantiacibacter gangjinensis]
MKPYVEAIHAYTPGKSKSADGRPLVKLSANENPLGCSPAALEALGVAGEPRLYPDPGATALREAIGALHGLDPARIVCGTGSDELLNLAAQGFAGHGDEVVFSRHSFAVYDIAANRCGATPVEVPDADFTADVDALLGAVTENTRVMFIANPNNPTGTFLPREDIARLHSRLPARVLLVLDQAYAEYLNDEDSDGGLQLAQQSDNALVTRTFSKIYGLAAERIGWATGAPHLVDALNRIRGPFNVTSSGQRAALAATADQDFVTHSREHNSAEREHFVRRIEALSNRGLRAVPSQANFVLVMFPEAAMAQRALEAIADAGYAVRHLPGPELSKGLRITIGKRADMEIIADTLGRVTGEDMDV